MKRGPTGSYRTVSAVGGERVRAFIPAPLPPIPGLSIEATLRDRLDEAHLALGRLDSVTMLLPDTELFLYTYVRKEAVLSSQIEGTQSSLSDLLLFEMDELPGVPIDDVTEVSAYVAALEYGMVQMREGLPISIRLMRGIHRRLLQNSRGAEKQPGEIRRTQNWIGGTRPGNAAFVPPPPDMVMECLGLLERWLHDEFGRTPTLIKAALSHVQIETIHPFLDGNGRLGRLLITLLLCAEGVLQQPMLYLSLYFKRNRAEYYRLLDTVREEGSWEEWMDFFARGVVETADGARNTAQRLLSLAQHDRDRIRSLGRQAGSALLIHHALLERPVANANILAERTALSSPTVNKVLSSMQNLGLIHEITGRQRNRVFTYAEYLAILSEGTEL